MGPNGSGKSTLGYVLAGHEGYEVTGGAVDLRRAGPAGDGAGGAGGGRAVPGVPVAGRAAGREQRQLPAHRAQRACAARAARPELDAPAFLRLARAESKRLHFPDDMLKRNVNVGFCGGEKKRNEVLQMAILRPKLAILDETDSGLDIDALRIVADGVNALRGPDFSALVITHHQRLLDHLVPDRVHVLSRGPHRAQRRAGTGARARGQRLRARWWRTRHEHRARPAARTRSWRRYHGLRERLPGDVGGARRGGRGVRSGRAADRARRGLEIHQPARPGRERVRGAADRGRGGARPRPAARRAARWCSSTAATSRSCRRRPTRVERRHASPSGPEFGRAGRTRRCRWWR